MAAAPPLRDRLSFLHRLPLLLKGTSDDEAPCPGYLFEEICKISHESLGSSQCLLEYLLGRLRGGSGRVKLKVLKILRHLCAHGSASFLLLLKRNPAFIQEAAVFAGPPDPLHGSSLYQKVRAAAQELGSTLFSDAPAPPPAPAPRALPPAGMGSQARPQGGLQGFGYSQERAPPGSPGEAFLSTVQKAAEAVASAVCPGPQSPGALRALPQGVAYQPAETPPAGPGSPAAGRPAPGAAPAARHRPGQAGGGWRDPESSPSPQGSSQGDACPSLASGAASPARSDSPSGASDLVERPGAAALRACQQEVGLVQAVTQGPRAFLSREEAQRFVRECGRLNCEVVLELLLQHLGEAGEGPQMRALAALAALGGTDLLAQEHVLLLARPRLQELSAGRPGPVASKATKMLRHLEASCGQHPPARRPAAQPDLAAAPGAPPDLLADAMPFTGPPASLQPLRPALFSAPPPAPRPHPTAAAAPEATPSPDAEDPGAAGGRAAGARARGAGPEPGTLGADSPEGRPGPAGTGPRDGGHGLPAGSGASLFAGMELLTCPGPAGADVAAEDPLPGTQGPRTLAPSAAAAGPPARQPSAFAFLNL